MLNRLPFALCKCSSSWRFTTAARAKRFTTPSLISCIVSTSRGLASTRAIQRRYRLAESLLSLRSEGSQSRILLRVESGHRFRTSFSFVLEILAPAVVFCTKVRRHDVLCERWSWIVHWRERHIPEIDHAFLLHPFDFCFQEDPLQLVFPGKSTFFSGETPVGRSPDNRASIAECSGRTTYQR